MSSRSLRPVHLRPLIDSAPRRQRRRPDLHRTVDERISTEHHRDSEDAGHDAPPGRPPAHADSNHHHQHQHRERDGWLC